MHTHSCTPLLQLFARTHALRRHDALPLLRDRDARERLTRGAAHGRVAHCVGRRMRWVGQTMVMDANAFAVVRSHARVAPARRAAAFAGQGRARAADARCGAWAVCTMRRETDALDRPDDAYGCTDMLARRRCSCSLARTRCAGATRRLFCMTATRECGRREVRRMSGVHIASGDHRVGSARRNTWIHAHPCTPSLQSFARGWTRWAGARRRRFCATSRCGSGRREMGCIDDCTDGGRSTHGST